MAVDDNFYHYLSEMTKNERRSFPFNRRSANVDRHAACGITYAKLDAEIGQIKAMK